MFIFERLFCDLCVIYAIMCLSAVAPIDYSGVEWLTLSDSRSVYLCEGCRCRWAVLNFYKQHFLYDLTEAVRSVVCSRSVLTVSLGPPRRILTSGCLSRTSWKFHNTSCENTTFVFRQHMRLFSPPNCLPPVFLLLLPTGEQRPSPFICLKFTTIFFDTQQKDLFQLPVSPAFHSPFCLLWTHSNTQKFDTSLTPGPACKESQGKQISVEVGWC